MSNNKYDMTLGQLINQFGQEEDISLEINWPDYGDWDNVDVVWQYSPTLEPYYDNKIADLTAIRLDTFRLTILDEKVGSDESKRVSESGEACKGPSSEPR